MFRSATSPVRGTMRGIADWCGITRRKRQEQFMEPGGKKIAFARPAPERNEQ
jgi:hypothetical protein